MDASAEYKLTHDPVAVLYDRQVEAMTNTDWVYRWVLAVWDRQAIDPAATVCDVGCGTGVLLSHLARRGYANLTGVDFSAGCVAATRQAAPAAEVYQHDIVRAPLPHRYDVITMTNVLDLVAAPDQALRHLHQSLRPGGRLILSVRNRDAYWPLYHLRGVGPLLPEGRWRHWFLWLTTPLAMRRSDWPYERAYSSREVRRLLHAAGFARIAEHGFQALPMLWIPDLPRALRAAAAIDTLAQRLPGIAHAYQCFFIYRPLAGPDRA